MTSTQSSNLSLNAQRRFAYDRWGNRTGVWDATSGGTQIQSVSLQQSGGAPTNRLTSVTNNTTTLNYSYDAAGNVTNDGVHSYTYDSENRVVSIDSGAASYGYDQQNRRYKKTIGSTVTHYVWEGGKVLGEYDGSTGGLQVAYWYAGERLFMKTGVTTQVFLRDRLSVRLTLSDIGAVVGRQAHLPYGEDFAESGTQQKQHFTSYERDSESGMDYAVNRQYNQGIGRFNRVDPKANSSKLVSPQTWNRYSYTANDPVNMTDPLGAFPSGGGFPWWLFIGPHETMNVNAGEMAPSLPFGDNGMVVPEKIEPSGPNVEESVGGEYEQLYSDLNPCERKVWDTLGELEKLGIYKAVHEAWAAAKQVAIEYPPADENGFPPDGSYGNAVQHCVWNCLMCRYIVDQNVAKKFAEAHECNGEGTPMHDEGSEMDRKNNAIGQKYGKEKGTDCVDRCKNGGELTVIREPKGPYK